jgi:hypothetical protein
VRIKDTVSIPTGGFIVFKKSLLILLVTLIILAAISIPAFASDSDFFIKNGVLERYDGPGGEVTVPEEVTGIGEFAFDSVTDIGMYAFYGCKSLASITIPGGVTNIDAGAFTSCPSLTTIIIPENVTRITSSTFYLSDNVTIYGIKDSYAHNYAKINHIKFAEYSLQNDGSIKLDQSSVTQTKPQLANATFDAADILNKLGLFNGVGTDAQGKPIFELDRAPTRQEALVMLIRLLGLEKTALAGTSKHPFDDVAAWADSYVGYAFSTGLTNGISQNKFGGNELITLQQYSTFLLRALRYSEKDNDFVYSNALDKAYELRIISSKDDSSFNRGSVAQLSYNVLLLPPKGETANLANKLLWDDVFTTGQLDNTKDGALMIAADMPDIISHEAVVYNLENAKKLIMLEIKNTQIQIVIRMPGFSEQERMSVFEDVVSEYTYHQIYLPEWNTNAYTTRDVLVLEIGIHDSYMMENYYKDPQRYQKHYHFSDSRIYIDNDEYFIYMSTWVNKINEILAECITGGMGEKDKVKAIHDYLILHTTYEKTYYNGRETNAAHMAKYIFTEGKGVCEAYAEAFKILMNAVGIECIMVPGEAGGVGHVWNQVKVDGKWYNTDVTWDDPDDGDKIHYDYFCIPDSKINKTHTVEKGFMPHECTAPTLKPQDI